LSAWREYEGEETAEWSAWHSSEHTPTGSWSLHANMCGENKTVIDIECKSLTNKPYGDMNENTQCVIPIGVYCRNAKLSDSSCSDYKARMLCIKDTEAKYHRKTKHTGYPKTEEPPLRDCNKDFDDTDYALLFPCTDEAVIENSYHTSQLHQEYLYSGKTEYSRKRILLKFDLRRIQRTDILHSATLQMYYTGESRDTFSKGKLSSTFIEVYMITSSNWNSSHVTGRVPWMSDYLKVGQDTDVKSLDKIEIKEEKNGWVNFDIISAVYKWRVATSHERKANYGLMIMSSNDQTTVGMSRFASSYHENSSIRPRLLICLSSSTW